MLTDAACVVLTDVACVVLTGAACVVLTGAAGRMPYTVYTADFVNQVSMEDMNMRANGTTNPGHTYRFYTGTPVYQFGHGLTYVQCSAVGLMA